MKKRILAILLVFSMLSSYTYAMGLTTEKAKMTVLAINKVDTSTLEVGTENISSATKGDVIAVMLGIRAGTEAVSACGYQVQLNYDKNALELWSQSTAKREIFYNTSISNENVESDAFEWTEPTQGSGEGYITLAATNVKAVSDYTTLNCSADAGGFIDIIQIAFKVKDDAESCNIKFSFDEEYDNKAIYYASASSSATSEADIEWGSASLAINGTTPALDKVELTGTTMGAYHTVTVKGGDTATQFIQASAISAKGNDISSKVTWSLSYPAGVTNVKGVTYDATGKVTIANNATAGTYTITATPKNGEVTGTAENHEFTVVREAETAASITISGGVATLYLPGNVALREGEREKDISGGGKLVWYRESQGFTATVTNQYGETTNQIPVEWTLVPAAEQTLGEQYRNNTDYDYCTTDDCTHENCEKYTYNNATGLEISASGHLLLTNACTGALGTATIQAKAGDKTATTTVTVTRADLQTATVTFTTKPDNATVPADGAEANTYNYAVAVQNQYGGDVSDPDVAWSISPTVTGVSISENGVLTVTNAAKATILSNATINDTFTITATCGGKSATTTVTVKRATAQPTSIAIYKDGTLLSGTTDTVTIPTGDTDNTYTYTAKVLDQYGAEMTDKTATLTAYISDDAGGVSFANDVLTVTKTAVENKLVLLTAVCTGLNDVVVTITLKDIDITPPTVTSKENPTYGDSWSDIVSFTGGSASLNGTDVAGTFYLKTTGKPDAGSQRYEIYFKSDDNQYDVLAKSGSVPIAKAPLTITANNKTITFGDAPAHNGVTYSGFISGENAETEGILSGTLDYEYSYTQYGAVGSSYTITPKGLSSDNYAITFVPGTLTVRAKPLAESMVGDITAVTYTGAAQRPTVTVTDGTTLTADTDYTVAYRNNTNAGTATATISGTGNYSGTVTKDFTINKKEITVATVTLADKTYNGGTDATVTDVTFDGVVEGDSLVKGTDFTATASYSSADAAEEAPATATVTLKNTTAANNYSLTNGTDFSTRGKVSKATIRMTLTAANATYTGLAYAGALTPSATNTQSSAAVTVTPDYAYYMDQECTTETTAANSGAAANGAAPKNVGTYYVKGSIAEDTNTSAASATASFQITKAPLTVTATAHTIIYGDAPGNAGVSYSGFVNGETTETSDLTGSIAYTYSYQQYGAVGSNYTITPRGLTSNNYDITFAPGKLTVEQREVGISWGDASFTYSGSAQAPAATATDTVNGDSVTVTVSGAQTNAGTDYTATATALSSGNYKLPASGLTKSFSIAKAELTNVSAAQSGTLTYNGRAQRAAVRWSATTVGSNTTTITYSTASGGTYDAQVPGFTAAGDDYTVYYKISAPNHNDATGRFSVAIGKRPLTVGPKSYTITVGATIPAFELEWNSVAEGDTLALSAEPSFECLTADGTAVSTSSAAGTYTIRWLNADDATLTGTNAENYEFTKLSTGTLTIEARHSTFNGSPVSLIRPKNGSVSISPAEAKEGATVTITVTPDSGYELESLTVTDVEGRRIALKRVGEGKYTFTMPDSAVTIRAGFGEHVETPFVDVPADKYFYDAVMWAVENGITGGVDATHFAPYASCTRGHLVTFLWRAAGEPEATSSKGFSDVAAKRSCAEAVLWAAENGIVGGYDNGTFRPDAAVTRQQAAAILWRFAKYAGMDVSVGEDTNILSYNDAFDVSEYAASAIQWAVGEGIMQGNKGYLLPGDTCTRAQIVTFLFRACAEQ